MADFSKSSPRNFYQQKILTPAWIGFIVAVVVAAVAAAALVVVIACYFFPRKISFTEGPISEIIYGVTTIKLFSGAIKIFASPPFVISLSLEHSLG